jgi:hypothetical protein
MINKMSGSGTIFFCFFLVRVATVIIIIFPARGAVAQEAVGDSHFCPKQWLETGSRYYGKYCGKDRCTELCYSDGTPYYYDADENEDPPVDEVDACCATHDCCVSQENQWMSCQCSRALLDCLDNAVVAPRIEDRAVAAAAAIQRYYGEQSCTCWFDFLQGTMLPSVYGQGGTCPGPLDDEDVLPTYDDWRDLAETLWGGSLKVALGDVPNNNEDFDCAATCVDTGECGDSTQLSGTERCLQNEQTLRDLADPDPAVVQSATKMLYRRIEASPLHERCINCVGPIVADVDADDIVELYEPIDEAATVCQDNQDDCMQCAADPVSCGSVPYNDECNYRETPMQIGALLSGSTVGATGHPEMGDCGDAPSSDSPGTWYTVIGGT